MRRTSGRRKGRRTPAAQLLVRRDETRGLGSAFCGTKRGIDHALARRMMDICNVARSAGEPVAKRGQSGGECGIEWYGIIQGSRRFGQPGEVGVKAASGVAYLAGGVGWLDAPPGAHDGH